MIHNSIIMLQSYCHIICSPFSGCVHALTASLLSSAGESVGGSLQGIGDTHI